MKVLLGSTERKLIEDGYTVFVFYERDEKRTPHTCRASIYSKEHNGIPQAAQLLAVGTAKCHPKDNFWKKKGRHMAVCRAAKQLKNEVK